MNVSSTKYVTQENAEVRSQTAIVDLSRVTWNHFLCIVFLAQGSSVFLALFFPLNRANAQASCDRLLPTTRIEI